MGFCNSLHLMPSFDVIYAVLHKRSRMPSAIHGDYKIDSILAVNLAQEMHCIHMLSPGEVDFSGSWQICYHWCSDSNFYDLIFSILIYQHFV